MLYFQIMSGSMSFDNLSSLSLMRTSESFSDLNAELSGAGGGSSSGRAPGRSSLSGLRATGGQAGANNSSTITSTSSSATAATGAEECNNNNNSSSNNNNKPFGLGEF